MPKYTITFSKERGGKYYQTIVEAVDEKDAFFKARDEAEQKDIKLPKEVWTRTHRHANVGVRSEQLCGFFEADNKTSSATKCKCGREKWEHPKDT